MNEPIEVEWDADQFAKLLATAVERGRQQGWREAIEALRGAEVWRPDDPSDDMGTGRFVVLSAAADYLTSVAPTEGTQTDG